MELKHEREIKRQAENSFKVQIKAKDLKITELNMELKHEREIKKQAEDTFKVQNKAKDLEIAMLTQERVKKIKQDWWLWGTVATALTICATSLADSNPSGNFDGDIYVAVFKPVDEEPYAVNNPKGYTKTLREEGVVANIVTTIGGGTIREVAAYLLHHPLIGPPNNPHNICFVGVAPTVMVRCRLHNDLNHGGGEETWKMKVGSLQMYHPNVGRCEDMGTSGFRDHDLHKISQLDIRLSNTDRNLGNILSSLGGHLLGTMATACLIKWVRMTRAGLGESNAATEDGGPDSKPRAFLPCTTATRDEAALFLKHSSL
ncbi:hypothetical protein ACLB2K_026854 [Fragaria x ananassa]